jgi:hypothetical protein
MNSLLLQYIYLQSLDALTTIFFLRSGLGEANPLLRKFIEVCSSQVFGIAVFKLLALGLGLYCWRVKRHKTLVRANVFYALLIGWNLLALIAGSRVTLIAVAWGLAA